MIKNSMSYWRTHRTSQGVSTSSRSDSRGDECIVIKNEFVEENEVVGYGVERTPSWLEKIDGFNYFEFGLGQFQACNRDKVIFSE